jgi:hypothetical protein
VVQHQLHLQAEEVVVLILQTVGKEEMVGVEEEQQQIILRLHQVALQVQLKALTAEMLVIMVYLPRQVVEVLQVLARTIRILHQVLVVMD